MDSETSKIMDYMLDKVFIEIRFPFSIVKNTLVVRSANFVNGAVSFAFLDRKLDCDEYKVISDYVHEISMEYGRRD